MSPLLANTYGTTPSINGHNNGEADMHGAK